MAVENHFHKILRFIFYILILKQCLAEIYPSNSTINSTMMMALRPPEGRIINGTPAKNTQFPFQVFVHADKYQCGGSIINKNTVLTAAHCVYYAKKTNKLIPAHKITVFAGDVNIASSNMQKFKVKKVIPHKKYDSRKVNYDIAILKIKENFWSQYQRPNIAPISITPIQFPENTTCIVSGWGTMSNGLTSRDLMHTKVTIYNHSKCVVFYKSFTNTKITESMLCANDTKSNVCTGDSGGPLIVNNTQTGNVPYLVGIVSFGLEGCMITVPSVYTDVYQYNDWITKNAGSYGFSHQIINCSQLIYSILLSVFIVKF